ncbi:MAG: UDP-N-acetylglucosamine 2-epimerase (non-hydrolyzing) [Cyclobacteriaceae bacterium]|nr:UDP-N-acetylglucosamine 2-epimerase (non-hydrolyzing) [Cyclobacteriaceae bacterium]
MKIVTVLGARPQFIKAATVSRALKKSGIDEIIIHTGQHFDANMSQVFFDEMDIPHPNYNLDIQGLNHGAMTGRMMEQIEHILIKEKPACVLVYGDTNSTLAGALTAAKLHIPVAHVEAGLRSFEMKMPEEVNRILTDRISQLLFCPTETAVANLEKEGFQNFPCEIEQPGDVMFDAVLYYQQKAETVATIVRKRHLTPNHFVLCTIHRAENTNDPEKLRGICEALNEINKQLPVVLPLHPRTKAYLTSQAISLDATIIEPQGYFDMLSLLKNCKLVMTDSGGLQKEAFFFKKFCLTLRDQTEWVELINAKVNYIVGSEKTGIVSMFNRLKNEPYPTTGAMYGEGNTAQLIARKLKTKFN